jgi:hypothetical protein
MVPWSKLEGCLLSADWAALAQVGDLDSNEDKVKQPMWVGWHEKAWKQEEGNCTWVLSKPTSSVEQLDHIGHTKNYLILQFPLFPGHFLHIPWVLAQTSSLTNTFPQSGLCWVPFFGLGSSMSVLPSLTRFWWPPDSKQLKDGVQVHHMA